MKKKCRTGHRYSHKEADRLRREFAEFLPPDWWDEDVSWLPFAGLPSLADQFAEEDEAGAQKRRRKMRQTLDDEDILL